MHNAKAPERFAARGPEVSAALIKALRALTADFVEHNPDDGPVCFFCRADVRYTFQGMKCEHAKDCDYVQALETLKQHEVKS